MKDKYFSILFLLLSVGYLLTVVAYEILKREPALFTSVKLGKIVPDDKTFDLLRDDKEFAAKVGMNMKDGDIVRNSSDTKLEISIRRIHVTTDGFVMKDVKLILDEDSEIEISESGIHTKSGRAKVYVNTRKYSFAVKTKYVKAGTKGTEFIVAMEPHHGREEKVSVIVAEGTVFVDPKPNGGKWKRVELMAPAKCVIYGRSAPQEEFVLNHQVEEAFRWAKEIQREPSRHEFLWDAGIMGVGYGWYVRIKADQLAKHQKSHNLFRNTYTTNLSDLRNFDPGSLEIDIVSANANCFDAEVRYPKIPGYMWRVDCDRNIEIVKEDPHLASKLETQLTIVIILFLAVSLFLFAKIVRKKLKD